MTVPYVLWIRIRLDPGIFGQVGCGLRIRIRDGTVPFLAYNLNNFCKFTPFKVHQLVID